MALAASRGKTRAPIKVQTMRELMFASGGRCAMTGCGLPLTSPSGGWIGTVAHIVGAEAEGPRGGSTLSPADRAKFENLILMCATHGREVDAPETGEANFPVDRLRQMKITHETLITDAVAIAIEQDHSGVKTGTDALDTALRPATSATTGDGLLESLNEMTTLSCGFVADLKAVQDDLQRLSQLALDTLAAMLALWVQECRHQFDDPSGGGPHLPYRSVENRSRVGGGFNAGIEELKQRNLISVSVDEDNDTAEYSFHKLKLGSQLRFGAWNFWISTAIFIYEGHGIEIHDWVKTLDFSIFDRVAPDGRAVSWRQ